MSPYFETIHIVHNQLQNLDYHNARVNKTREAVFGRPSHWDLTKLIMLPQLDASLVYRCRFEYGEQPGKTEFFPYSIRNISTLILVECPDLDYHLKYTDRTYFERLKLQYNQVDDVIIVQNRRITDCTYANLAFFNGTKWITPAAPLLHGTKRQQLLHAGRIEEQELFVTDIKLFREMRIINAMIDLEDSPSIAIHNIFW